MGLTATAMSDSENGDDDDSKDWEALRKSKVSDTPDDDPRGDDEDE